LKKDKIALSILVVNIAIKFLVYVRIIEAKLDHFWIGVLWMLLFSFIIRSIIIIVYSWINKDIFGIKAYVERQRQKVAIRKLIGFVCLDPVIMALYLYYNKTSSVRNLIHYGKIILFFIVSVFIGVIIIALIFYPILRLVAEN
jgi:hypothetical protein